MYDHYKQIGWDKSGSVWDKHCAGALYQIHPYGDYFIAYKFQYNLVLERVGAIVARFVASDRQTAQEWADTHCDIDTDPWDNTPEAKADHETARQRLQELHQLEKEQDRYRIHN